MIFAIIHSFVNIFAGGLSGIKTLLFIIYLPALGIIYLALKSGRLKPLKWRWFGFSLLAMYLYGLGLYLFYALSNCLPLTKIFITGRNGEISLSFIRHNQVAKATIAQILSYFGKTELRTIDAGGAYLGIFPSWVFLLGSVLLAILILQAFLYFTASFRQILEDKNNRQKVFLIIGYAIASFSLIKTSIDGGIFDPGCGLSLLFIALFILRERKKSIVSSYFILPLAGLGLLSFFIFRYGHMIKMDYTAAMILLYAVILYGSEKKIKPWALALLSLSFLASWWICSGGDRDIYRYSKISLPAGSRVYIYDENARKEKIIEIERTQSIGETTKELGKNINYLPLIKTRIDCLKSAPRPAFAATLISREPLGEDTLISSRDIIISNKASWKYGKSWRTELRISLNPCLTEILPIVNGELKNNHIDDYLLIPKLP